MSQKLLFKLLKTIVPLGIGTYLFWYFFASMTEEGKNLFYSSIFKANYFWITLSILVGIISHMARAYRWKYVLEPIGHKTSFWNRYHAIMIGYVINLTIPRAGEASRCAMLYRAEGVPFSTSFGTILAERMIDLFVLGILTLLASFISYTDLMEIKSRIQTSFGFSNSENTGTNLGYYILAVLLVLIAIILWKKPELRLKVKSFIFSIFSGVFSIFKSKQPWGYLVHTILIWGCYIGGFGITFQAFPETADLPFKAMLIGFLAGTVGIIFTNGGIGVYPILVGMVFGFYMGDDAHAIAIGNALGMLLWCTQTALLIILGLISLALLPKKYQHEQTS